MLPLDERVDERRSCMNMITLDCPWCDGPMALEAESDDVACDGCSVRVELAPDPRPMVTARAA
jgi:hypothetical protein